MATKEQVYEFARQEAQRQGVPYSLVQKIVETESGGSFNAIGPKTRFNDRAYGPMQLMSATAKDLGVNRMDWKDNIRGGVKYLGQLTERFQDPTLVAAAYNAGPSNVEKYGGIPPFKETQNYVQKVVGTNMATYRDIDPSLLGQTSPKIDLRGMATQDQQNAGFREIDPSMIGQPIVQQTPTRQNQDSIARQVGLTARYGMEGLGQVADIVGSPLNMLINRATGSQLGTPSQSMSNFATMLGLPQPQTGLERGVGNVTRALAGVPAMAGVGGLLQQAPNLTTQVVGRGLAAQPAAQIAGATAGTGAAEIARNQFDVQNPLALLGINLAAGLPASAVAARAANIPSGTNYRDPVTGQLIESAAQRGVNIDVGDVGGPGSTLLRKTRQFGDTTQDANQAKSAQVRNLIEKVTEQVKPASVTKEGGEKLVIANDLRTQYRNAKDAVSPIFDRAEKLAGNTQIPLSNTNNATLEVLDKFPAVADNAFITRLVERANNLSQAGGGTYKELRTLQKSVGSELNRVQKAPATYGEEQIAALSKLYGGLSDDVNAWAAPRTINNKPVYTPAGAEHARAMEQFRNTVVPFRQDQDIYKIVSSKTPANEIDKIAQSFSLTGNPATADLAVSLMSDTGKQAAQYSILNQARSAAINADAATMLSSPAFTRTLNLGRSELPSAQRIVMGQTPEVMGEVGLLRNIVDATRGAVTPKAAPQTGALNVPLMTTGMGAGAGAGAATSLGFDPTIGAMAGVTLVPPMANRLSNALSSQSGTRYLLGEQLQGAGGMGSAMGQGINAATTKPEDFFPSANGLFDMFR
jgi:soluble lytic murein transglycosylase-like protein